mmetsp:Transcript_21676/g.34250  ORF Transcript_21676/g.34250 Transcript_21676/m.34250 type:complete len:728 (-) Transcript_21676:21-2204(-)
MAIGLRPEPGQRERMVEVRQISRARKFPKTKRKKKENGPPAGFTEWVKGWKHGWGLQLPASDRSQSWAYMPVISRAIERYRTLWGVERLSVPMGCRDLSRRELQFWSQVEDFHECVELVIEAFKTIPIARSLVSETRNWDRKDHLKASIQNALGCIRVKLPQKGDGADEKLDSSPPKPRVQIISQSIQLMAARVLLWVNSVTPNPNPKPASSSAPPILQNTTQTSAPAKLNSEKNVENSAAEEISEVRISVGDGAKKRREAGERGGWRLGLPAISIGEMAFPGQKGAAICAAALKTFFLRYPDEKIEIVLVADPVRKPGAKVKAKKGDEGCEEFFNEISKILKEEKRVKLVRRGRIWKLNTDIDTPASFVVCLPNNWRFKGGQLSFEMNRAASTSKESLQKLTLRTHTRGAKVGRAYSVEVPAGCPLQDTEGGDTVIHALGPNLNKSLPDYIPEKLPEGREPPEQLLLQTYQSVLEEFAKFLHLPKPLPQAPQYALPTSGESEEKLFPADSAKFRYNAPPPLKGGNKGDWKSALLNYIKNPGENKESIFWKDQEFIAVYDRYPKAKVHILLLPRQRRIDKPSDLTRGDIPLLNAMLSRASWIVERIRDANTHLQMGEIKMGFHAIPSLRQVHLHIISDDFDSPCLKNKKHWNSFTTEFFIPPFDVLTALKANGRFSPDKKHFTEILRNPLKCHKCGTSMSMMPKLKIHIKRCNGNSRNVLTRRESSL